MLPNEVENRNQIREVCREDFNLAEEWLTLGVHVGQVLCEHKDSEHTIGTLHVIANLLARETRRFRMIIEAASFGFVENVEVLARSLYEGLLAERFILVEPKDPAQCSSAFRGENKDLPPMPDDCPAVHFRAMLYVAFESMKLLKLAKQIREHEGTKDQIDEATYENFADAAEDAKQLITGVWADVLSKAIKMGRNYSGMSIRHLAESRGLLDVHVQVYGLMALKSHANDSSDLLSVEDDNVTVNLAGTTTRLPSVLSEAGSLFGQILLDANQAFDLKVDELTGLRQRHLDRARNP